MKERNYVYSCNLKAVAETRYDVIIVGSGIAGLYAALNLDEKLSCALLNKAGFEESNSNYAQGGVATVRVAGDSTEDHFEDTLKAGAGLCDHEAVRVLVEEGPKDIDKLIELGVPFDKDEKGEFVISREGAHRCDRIMHCGGDATGFHLTKTLADTVKQRSNITCMEQITLVDVLTDKNDSVCGVVVLDGKNKYRVLSAPYVILATGGIGRVYRNSTNSSCATADGIAAAFRAGAELHNMEFVQFHPTALIHPDMTRRFFLISEALRGEGAILRNRKWEAFMENVHPMKDLAPRDIVSRAIVREMKKYDLPNVYLDITSQPREVLQKRFPVIYQECFKRGIDIAADWIPVFPVQHYFMGGIKTDTHGRTTIDGLFACGESACTGVHGANRLASNSLLECLVYGRRCAEQINGSDEKPTGSPVEFSNSRPEKMADFDTMRTNIRTNMTKKCGVLRNGSQMKEAKCEIEAYYSQLSDMKLHNQFEIETMNIATTALQIVTAALEREKSVGAHFREDDESSK